MELKVVDQLGVEWCHAYLLTLPVRVIPAFPEPATPDWATYIACCPSKVIPRGAARPRTTVVMVGPREADAGGAATRRAAAAADADRTAIPARTRRGVMGGTSAGFLRRPGPVPESRQHDDSRTGLERKATAPA